MAQMLTSQGFFFVSLDEATIAALETVHAATHRLWSLPATEKNQCVAEAVSPVLGYAHRENYRTASDTASGSSSSGKPGK